MQFEKLVASTSPSLASQKQCQEKAFDSRPAKRSASWVAPGSLVSEFGRSQGAQHLSSDFQFREGQPGEVSC